MYSTIIIYIFAKTIIIQFVVSKSVVIIPTYNEKENIEKLIRTVYSLPGRFNILIIDDHSPDGTADLVKGLPERISWRNISY